MDVFLRRRGKEELAVTKLYFHSLKNILGGVSMTTGAATFATAFRRLL
jgi:hypothetical protein